MNKKLIRKIYTIICVFTIFSMVGPFSFGNVKLARAVDPISGLSVSAASTTASAVTSYTFSFTLGTDMVATGNDVGIFNVSTWFQGPPGQNNEIDFSNATLDWLKDDGAAVAGASLNSVPESNMVNVSFSSTTIASGSAVSFKLSNVVNSASAGTYNIMFGAGIDGPSGMTNLGETQYFLLLGIDMFIQGTVTYDTGGPVTTCSVNANSQAGQDWANADCDSNGFYQLGLTTAGVWQLHLDAKWVEGSRVTTDWIFDGMDEMVDVTAAGTYTKNITVIKATSTVTGKVTVPAGTNPWEYNIDLRTEEGKGSGSGLANDGSFSIPVKPGTYRLSLWSQNPKYYIPEQKVTVGVNETKNLGTLTLSEKTAKIQGTVRNTADAVIADLRMNMWSPSGWGDATTAADGTYTLWAYPGEWEVMVDQWDAGRKGYITSGPPTRVNITSATQTVTGVDFTVQLADATINLNFVNADGSTPQNMFGYAFCRKANAMPGPGSDFGTGIMGSSASIPILGGQTYLCGAHLPPEMNVSVGAEVEVSIAVGETKNVNITLLQNDSRIVGYLRDAVTGDVITGVDGEVFAHGEGFGMGYNAFINPDGSYSLSVRSGTYFVGHHIRTPGYMQGDSNQAPVFAPANGQVVKTIKVHKANAFIVATVLDPDGNSVPWAWVWCDNMKQKEDEVKGPFEGGEVLHTGGDTGGNGQARLGVVAGTYSCSAGLPPEMSSFMPPDMVDVTALANTDTAITLQFKRSEGTMTGSVTREDGTTPNMGFCHAWNPNGGFSGGPVFGGTYTIPLTRGTWYVGCESMDGKNFYRSDETPITLTNIGDTISKDFVLRKSAFEIPEGITQTFDASQLTVINLPDGSTISIPANAIATSGNYTVTASPNVNLYHTPEAKPALGFAWSLELTNSSGQSVTTNFNDNVTITIFYDDDMLVAEGIDETKIIGRYWDENSSTWKLPDNVVQDIENNTVQMMVNHFTDFTITTGSDQIGSRTPKSIVTAPKNGGGPHVTVWNSEGTNESNFLAYASNFRGGVEAVKADLDGDGNKEIITVPYSTGGPHVRVFNTDGDVLGNLFPYVSAFRGGISLAVGDVDGDGSSEIIVAPTSGGGPHVRVYKYSNGSFTHHASFFPYPTGLRTGMEVHAGDVDGDGADEIVTTTRSGATPHVRIFDGSGNLMGQFFAFPTAYKGGVNAVLGDYTGDGSEELVLTPASNGGPQYRVMSYNGTLVQQGFAYSSSYRIGLKAGVGDVDGDGVAEVVLAPTQGGPHIQVIGPSGLENQFMAYDPAFRGGLELAVADLDADGAADIITVPMSSGGPHVKVFAEDGTLDTQFMSHHEAFRGGVNLSVSQ